MRQILTSGPDNMDHLIQTQSQLQQTFQSGHTNSRAGGWESSLCCNELQLWTRPESGLSQQLRSWIFTTQNLVCSKIPPLFFAFRSPRKTLYFWLSAGTPYTWARTEIFWIWFIFTREGCVVLWTYSILKKCKSETTYWLCMGWGGIFLWRRAPNILIVVFSWQRYYSHYARIDLLYWLWCQFIFSLRWGEGEGMK